MALESDRFGVVHVPRSWLASESPAATTDAPYRVVGVTAEATDQWAVWVVRDVEVEVTVSMRPEDADAIGSPRVDLYVVAGGVGHPPTREVAPWSITWLRGHGLENHQQARPVGAERIYSAVMPRVRGLAVIARGSKDRSAVSPRRVDLSSDMEHVGVDLALAPPSCVSGRLHFPDGVRAVDARPKMTLTVAAKGSLLEIDMQLGGLVQAQTSSSKRSQPESASFTFKTTADVAPDGTFRVPFYEQGEGMLLVQASDCFVEEIPLGLLTVGRDAVDVYLRRTGTPVRLRLFDDGASLAGRSVTFVDLSQTVGQSAYGPYAVDSDGWCPADFLQLSREYRVLVSGESVDSTPRVPAGKFLWEGQSSIDVTRDLTPK